MEGAADRIRQLESKCKELEDREKRLEDDIDLHERRDRCALDESGQNTIAAVKEIEQFAENDQRYLLLLIDSLLEITNEVSDILLCLQQFRSSIDVGKNEDDRLFHKRMFRASLVFIIIEYVIRIAFIFFDIDRINQNTDTNSTNSICSYRIPRREYDYGTRARDKFLAGLCMLVEPNFAENVLFKKLTKKRDLDPAAGYRSGARSDFYELYNDINKKFAARKLLFVVCLVEDIPEFIIEVIIGIRKIIIGIETDRTKNVIYSISIATTVLHLSRHLWSFCRASVAKTKVVDLIAKNVDVRDLIGTFRWPVKKILKELPDALYSDVIREAAYNDYVFGDEFEKIGEDVSVKKGAIVYSGAEKDHTWFCDLELPEYRSDENSSDFIILVVPIKRHGVSVSQYSWRKAVVAKNAPSDLKNLNKDRLDDVADFFRDEYEKDAYEIPFVPGLKSNKYSLWFCVAEEDIDVGDISLCKYRLKGGEEYKLKRTKSTANIKPMKNNVDFESAGLPVHIESRHDHQFLYTYTRGYTKTRHYVCYGPRDPDGVPDGVNFVPKDSDEFLFSIEKFGDFYGIRSLGRHNKGWLSAGRFKVEFFDGRLKRMQAYRCVQACIGGTPEDDPTMRWVMGKLDGDGYGFRSYVNDEWMYISPGNLFSMDKDKLLLTKKFKDYLRGDDDYKRMCFSITVKHQAPNDNIQKLS